MEEQRVGTAYGDAGVSYEREGANPRHAEWWQQIQHCRKHFVSDASVEQALQFTPRSGVRARLEPCACSCCGWLFVRRGNQAHSLTQCE